MFHCVTLAHGLVKFSSPLPSLLGLKRNKLLGVSIPQCHNDLILPTSPRSTTAEVANSPRLVVTLAVSSAFSRSRPPLARPLCQSASSTVHALLLRLQAAYRTHGKRNAAERGWVLEESFVRENKSGTCVSG